MIPPEIIEFAVWSRLDGHKNPELVLLKGHLVLEIILDNAIASFTQRGNTDSLGLSFHRKLELLNLLYIGNESDFTKCKKLLSRLNSLRNKLAHHADFEDGLLGLGEWSENVLAEFPSIKFTKYTFRTKIVHAFAVLARIIQESIQRPNQSFNPDAAATSNLPPRAF